MSEIVHAEIVGNAVRYYDRCGGYIERAGGSDNWRYNNPGGILAGNPPKSGEITDVGTTNPYNTMAIFETYADGVAAFQEQIDELISDDPNSTLTTLLYAYYPNFSPEGIGDAAGINPNEGLNGLTPNERLALLNAIRQAIGWDVGTQSPYKAGPGGSNFNVCQPFNMGEPGPGGAAHPPPPGGPQWPPFYPR